MNQKVNDLLKESITLTNGLISRIQESREDIQRCVGGEILEAYMRTNMLAEDKMCEINRNIHYLYAEILSNEEI